MLISDRRIIESILDTLERLQRRSDIPKDAIFDLSVAAKVLYHSRYVDQSGGDGMRTYCWQAIELLQTMRADATVSAKVRLLLDETIAEANVTLASRLNGNKLKQKFIQFVIHLDQTLGQIAKQAPDIATPLFAKFAERLLKHHNMFSLFGSDGEDYEQDNSSGEPLTTVNLTNYIQQQLSDPTVQVTNIITLTGGFGKETSLFTAKGSTFSSDFVMRRDSPLDVCGGLDCHTAAKEFPLLKAIFQRGFLVPEPIWHEDNPQIIKGPAFTIMRRSPGATIGGATGGQGKVPAEQQRILAQITARLHNLPQLTELSDIPAFAPGLWKLSACDSARNYISAWYEHYLNASHLPLPALHGLFNWMLANVPHSEESSGLIHGDIGFHNLLFDNGELSAVLDWEFAHIGDPAEDIGYIRSVMGNQLDWPTFMAEYSNAGRPVPSAERVRFYEIWSHVRNAVSSVLFAEQFEAGRFRHIKYGMIVYGYLPHFITKAEELITSYKK